MCKDTVTIRECVAADEQAWFELNKEFVLYEYQDENVWENPLEKGDMTEIFRDIIAGKSPSNRLFMVEKEGAAVGFMNTVSFLSPWAHGWVLFLDDLFIAEEHRSKGYGKQALKALEDMIRTEGYVRLQLMAEHTNPGAVKFYEREGYSKQELNFFCKYL